MRWEDRDYYDDEPFGDEDEILHSTIPVADCTYAAGKPSMQQSMTSDTLINAEEIQVTGKKALDKKYYRHTGFPGGIRETNFEKLIAHKPEAVLEKAVKGMLPKGPLGYAMIKKMKVYAGTEHPHAAQQPQVLDI